MALLFRSKKKTTELPTGTVSPNFAATKEVKKWSVGEVCEWLNMQGLASYKNNFAERMINGSDLVDIEERDLDSLKVTKFADRKKLMNAIKALTSKEVKPFDSGSKTSSVSKPATDTSSTHSEDIFEDDIAITVKCYYNDDIRSFDIESLNFDTLKKKIEDEYQQQFIMKYKDEENELVSLSTTAGLKLAIRSGNVLKLYLYPLQALTVAETKLLDDIVDAVLVIDTNGHMLYVNPATEKMFGYTKKQLLYKNVRMLMTKKDSKKHNSYIERYVETGIAQIIGKGRIVDCKNADGEEFKARLSVNETKKDGKHFFTGTIHKLETDDLANTSVNVSSFIILDGFLDPMVVIDEKGTIMFFNKAAENIFGFTKIEVQGRNVKTLMPEPFKSEHDVYLANYNRSGISKIMGTGRDVPIQKKDGSICMCHLKLNKSDIGGKIYYTGSLTLETKTKETLSMLEQERIVLKEMLIPAIIIDSRGTMQAFNVAAQNAFGYTMAEMIGKNVNTLMFDEQREKHDSYLKHYMDTGESKIIGVGRKVVVRKKDGSALPCKLFVTKKSDGSATFFTGVLQQYESSKE